MHGYDVHEVFYLIYKIHGHTDRCLCPSVWQIYPCNENV